MPTKKHTPKASGAKKTTPDTPPKKAAKAAKSPAPAFSQLKAFFNAVGENVASGANFCSVAGRDAFKNANRTPGGKVNFSHVDKRTRAMLYCQHGLININPTAPLLTAPQRLQLKGPINAGWFNDVGCNISNAALTAANTLNKLETAIHAACTQKV